VHFLLFFSPALDFPRKKGWTSPPGAVGFARRKSQFRDSFFSLVRCFVSSTRKAPFELRPRRGLSFCGECPGFASDHPPKGSCPVPTLDDKQGHKAMRSVPGAIPIRLPPPVRDVGQVRGVRGCLLSCGRWRDLNRSVIRP